MDATLRNGRGGEIPRPGEVICGKYRIENVVGTGGMGVVMGATDTSLNRAVAIKFLSPERVQREGAVARFLREARSAAAIQSEHVVRVFDVSTLPNGAPFIVMEHLRGGDLSQLLTTRGALSIEEACDYVLQACEALGEAHARGIVHRDLKPQNLFLAQRPDGSPLVKVLDFGISKAAFDGDGAPPQNLTATDTVMGTPLYMSPEQVRSLKNVDHRADIWALGSILFELLTMSPIFEAPSASALCAMIAMDPPTPLRARRPQAPAELEAVILRCLHKDPAGRFQDVGALAEALAPFASERGRLSATRVSAILRGTAPAPFGSSPAVIPAGFSASTTGTGPTMGDPSRSAMFGAPSVSNAPPPNASHPPFGAAGSGPSLPPGQHPPNTQSNWHQTNTGTREKSGTSGVIVAMLGVLTGLVLLGVIGGGAYVYVSRRDAALAAKQTPPATDDGGNAGAMTAAPVPTTSAAPTATSTATSKGNANIKKDGGTPSQKDGGAGPSPGPDKDKEEQERNAALGRQAEANCRVHTQNMTTFAHDDASRKEAAQRAKNFMCRGMVSSRCERQVCLQACMTLNDQPCIQNITYVIDHGPPPKY